MKSALGLQHLQNFDMYHPGYALVGRTVQVGPITGIVTAYNQLEDTFNIQFQLTGPVMKVSRANLAPLLLSQDSPRTMSMQFQQANLFQGQTGLSSPRNAFMLPQLTSPRGKDDDNDQEAADAVGALFRAAQGINHRFSWLPLAAAAAAANGSSMIDRSVVTKSSKQLPFGPSKTTTAVSNEEANPAKVSTSGPKGNGKNSKRLLATTKTGVFKMMHSCYRLMSGINGRQDAYYGANNVPSYEDIEAALETDSTINTARISTLRSRYLMAATLEDVKDKLPCVPEKYVINSITTACPMCGRAIALNKLASHENWCKHLECSHGSTGASIAVRFRAYDKNSDNPPPIDKEYTNWVNVENRNDMAPLNLDINENNKKLVPFTSHLHWHAVMFHQLMLEDALSPSSILAQELIVKGLKHYGLRIDAQARLEKLFQFQQGLSKFSNTFKAYAVEHIDVINEEEPDIPISAKWAQAILSTYTSAGDSQPSFKSIELAVQQAGGKQGLNASRLLVIRNRQILKAALEAVGFTVSTEQVKGYTINAFMSCCPLCGDEVRMTSCDLGDDSLCQHLERSHGPLGKEIAKAYRLLDKSERVRAGDLSLKCDLPELKIVEERADLAKAYEDGFKDDEGIISLEYDCIDWRGLLFDNLLTNKSLSPCSVLTQEIVVLGLFYFGLVNQRSPQKFGQYPQLQIFQKGLHEYSSTGYDLYCGAGIKEGELGSSHTRGRPVQATKDVISRYHHYGLSHKSLQRNDRKRLSPKGSKANAKATRPRAYKRKKVRQPRR